MRRYLPFIIVAAVALLTLETGIALFRVDSDQKRGTAKGVAATPTIFVDDGKIPVAVVLARLHTAIDEALKPQSLPDVGHET